MMICLVADILTCWWDLQRTRGNPTPQNWPLEVKYWNSSLQKMQHVQECEDDYNTVAKRKQGKLNDKEEKRVWKWLVAVGPILSMTSWKILFQKPGKFCVAWTFCPNQVCLKKCNFPKALAKGSLKTPSLGQPFSGSLLTQPLQYCKAAFERSLSNTVF